MAERRGVLVLNVTFAFCVLEMPLYLTRPDALACMGHGRPKNLTLPFVRKAMVGVGRDTRGSLKSALFSPFLYANTLAFDIHLHFTNS